MLNKRLLRYTVKVCRSRTRFNAYKIGKAPAETGAFPIEGLLEEGV